MKPKWPEIIWASCDALPGDAPRVLGINPWIHDFAAFNLWSRPAGLLAALSMLRSAGAHVALMDCMDRTWSDVPWPKAQVSGKGHYPKMPLPTPEPVLGVPRRFSRYGHHPDRILGALRALSPPPDLVLVTTVMTYWYPGVREILRLIRKVWPKVPVVLGGVYATLCPEHALTLGTDAVLTGTFEHAETWRRIWRFFALDAPPLPENAGFALALDLYSAPDFSVILGSRGCPFRCAYCASSSLYPAFRQASFETVLATVQREYARGVRHFAFYDDALLVKPETWLWPLLDWFTGKGAFLHTPNAMHVRYLTPEVCRRLKDAGLTTVRLGLETLDFRHRLDAKLESEEWDQGLAALRHAGFGANEIGAYVLFGLPDQDDACVRETVRVARQRGVRPELAYFTPIPSSALFQRACEVSSFPLRTEPLCQNNSIWPCVPGGFSWEQARRWREVVEGR